MENYENTQIALELYRWRVVGVCALAIIIYVQ